MPEKNLPFFEMFALYTPDAALAAQVKAWLVTGAVMDRKARTIEVQLLCPATPDPALLARLSGEVAQAYGLAGVVFQPASPLLMRMFRRSQRLWRKLRLLPKRILPTRNRLRP